MTISFAADGTARCLWSEIIDLAALGTLHVERVTNIAFSNTRQEWLVVSMKSGLNLFHHKLRSECVRWELEHLQP